MSLLFPLMSPCTVIKLIVALVGIIIDAVIF